jgi:hypothetical protein
MIYDRSSTTCGTRASVVAAGESADPPIGAGWAWATRPAEPVGARTVVELVYECDAADKPVCVAQVVSLLLPGS